MKWILFQRFGRGKWEVRAMDSNSEEWRYILTFLQWMRLWKGTKLSRQYINNNVIYKNEWKGNIRNGPKGTINKQDAESYNFTCVIRHPKLTGFVYLIRIWSLKLKSPGQL